MDEETKTPEDIEFASLYEKGFHNGRLLAEFDPKMAEIFAKAESPSPAMQGFRDGKKDFEREQREPRDWSKETIAKDFNETTAPAKDNESKQPTENKSHRPDYLREGYLTDQFNRASEQPPTIEDRDGKDRHIGE